MFSAVKSFRAAAPALSFSYCFDITLHWEESPALRVTTTTTATTTSFHYYSYYGEPAVNRQPGFRRALVEQTHSLCNISVCFSPRKQSMIFSIFVG